MNLVETNGLEALKKIGLEKGAIALATMAKESGAATGSTTLEFLKEDEESDGEFVAKLTVTVERVTHA